MAHRQSHRQMGLDQIEIVNRPPPPLRNQRTNSAGMEKKIHFNKICDRCGNVCRLVTFKSAGIKRLMVYGTSVLMY